MRRMNLLVLLYDFLAGLAFGEKIKKATTQYFDLIGEHDKVLIIGGGTGWILEKLPHRNLQVTYVDLSEGMIRKSKSRNISSRIKFITGSYTSIPDEKYDVVITPFFLDMFSSSNINDVVQHIATSLRKDGLWLFADFRDSKKIYHRILIKVLYLFFSLFYNIKTFTLPDYNYWFDKNQLQLIKQKDSNNRLFTSRVYRRKNESSN